MYIIISHRIKIDRERVSELEESQSNLSNRINENIKAKNEEKKEELKDEKKEPWEHDMKDKGRERERA